MVDNFSLERVARIMKRIESSADAAVLATLKEAADSIISDIDKYWLRSNAMRFKGVTGNAYSSITIGVYQGRKLQYVNWNGKHVRRPTRPTLAEGEPYPLPLYYDGDAASGKPYVGEYGNGGIWGNQLGPWVMYAQRYKKSVSGNDFSMVVAIPVSYAGYQYRIVHAMQNIMDAIPGAVKSNAVRIDIPHEGSLDFGDTDGAPF